MFGLHPAGAQTTWDAGGDSLTWTDPLNWDTNALPQPTDATIFNLPAPTTIHLNGDQVIDSLVLQDDYSIGAFGTGKRLSLNSATTPNITVGAGVLGTVNALLTGQALNVGGTGTLYLTNLFNNPNSVNLDGATLLLNNPGGPPRLSGTGIQLNNRSDALVLGPGAKTITMTNGGGVKIIGSGYNPDGTTKAFVFGTGGGVINVASGFQQFSLDDPAQVSGTGNVTREGGGRLTITSQDYDLAGNLILNGGVTEWGRLLAGGAAGTRFSAFSTASTVTVNGGMLVPNSGTAGVIDQAITLSTGGVLGMQGQDHQYGVTAGAGTPLTLNGGTILTRDSFTPQTQRFIRIDSLLQGSGTVDLVGSTNAGGAPRVVFQRGDLAHTFDGTFRLVGNTTLETNPRHSANIGNALGSATLELSGFNSGLDMRDNGAASGAIMNYTGNDINVNSPELGGIQRLVVNQNVAGSTGNTFSFGNLSIGNNNWFQISGANGYQTRFGTLNLAPGGTSRLDVISAPTTITNAVANPGSNLIRWASNTGTASNLVFESPVSLAGLDIRHGNVTLANNATLATQRLTINAGGNNNLTTGSLVLDNTAANLTDRLPDALPIAMRGGALTLIAGGAAPASETTGNLSVPFGNPLFTATSSATQPAALTLGAAPPVQGPTAVGAFSGRNLGLGGATDSSILLPGIPPLPFLGGGVIAGGGATPPAYPNEWAKYGAAGVTPFVAADYVINSAEPAWLPAEHIKQTGVAAVTLTGARNVATLNLQPTGAGLSIATNGNLLTVEQGGILTSANAASITGTAAGGLTAGTGGAANLYVNNAAQLDINAIIQNNGAGAVTLVKSSPGVLRLTNQNPAAPHTNTHTGGTVVNNGTLEPWRLGYLGSGPVTLAGGRLNLNIPGFASNTVLAGGGQNVIVEANSFLDADNNGETGGNGSNNTASFGSLAIRGHNLGFGGFDNYDVHFANGATVDPGSSITMIGGRDANSNIIVNGLTSGPGLLIASPSGGGGNPQNQFGSGGLTLGGGSGDLTPNTLGAVDGINVNAGTLRLNKANGINAVGATSLSTEATFSSVLHRRPLRSAGN